MTKKNKNQNSLRILRVMILIGVLSLINFFYWFFKPDLVENRPLFLLLTCVIFFDTFRLLYTWYHYWGISIPNKPKHRTSYKVDVFTTFCDGEPIDMVTQTLLAIKKMDYPHETYLCDEDDNAYLKNFCKENGIIHVTRTSKENAKAGNINNALKIATGDVCVIMDPDHVPETNFLTELLPYFEDEKIGFVQSVQGYYNQNESKVALGAAEQTYQFYGPVMMSMNSYGTVNAIGANCVFRRKALDSIGGHSPGLSEDMHTAMQLYAKGWKSVYVPKMLTKGLVPSTLSSYFKQQLKWSRGTFELLISVFPKLFSNFTLRQKLHFGIIPLHYLAGIVYFFVLLIPILSLFFSTTPWRGNIYNFWLITLPIFASILGIRLFVQKWIIKKSERGMHITGGLLFHTTWSIFILGVFYSLIRKKIPYIPTPKTGEDKTPFALIAPNLFMGILSVAAIIYGLQRDFTPFSLFMSGFALWNASDMFYTLVFAFEKTNPISIETSEVEIKKSFFKNQFFNFWQSAGIIIVLIIFGLSVYFQVQNEKLKLNGVVVEEMFEAPKLTYLGCYYPESDNGFTSLKRANQFSANHEFHPDIISVYLPWDKNIESTFPSNYLDSIFINKSLPLITWEPWLNSFQIERQENRNVYQLINEGVFDVYITQFAKKLKELKKPIFLRFAHEFDNPFYPWFVEGEAQSFQFKEAWVKVHSIFNEVKAHNVIWVWNPWKSENVKAFYPGNDFVDWIGLDILNYESNKDSKGWYSFDELYTFFRDNLDGVSDKPVIIAEFGSVGNDKESQANWIENGISDLQSKYPEIQAVVFFNSRVDDNIPVGIQNEELVYDWTFKDGVELNFGKFKRNNKLYSHYSLLENRKVDENFNIQDNTFAGKKLRETNIYGVNINKGQNWKSDYHVLNRINLKKDFQRMKTAGINTVKFIENTTYDYNLLEISKENELNVNYSFFIPLNTNFLEVNKETDELKTNILKRVRKYQKYNHIISWSFENDFYSKLPNNIKEPDLTLYRNGYLNWLKTVVSGIRQISDENIFIGIEGEGNLLNKLEFYSDVFKQDIGINIQLKSDQLQEGAWDYINNLGVPVSLDYLGDEISTNWKELANGKSFYYVSWQDQFAINKLTFDGLIDRKGRLKNKYFDFIESFGEPKFKYDAPNIKILKQNKTFYPGNVVVCYAMFYGDRIGWEMGGNQGNYRYEWNLLKYKGEKECISIEKVGEGSEVYLKVPKDPNSYKLMLTVIDKENVVTQTFTDLKP
ncbi:glycosyltransferase family 2 protein [Mangrovimonas sp. ST2L15]|uniref:glycosyltransferase family 2 protein n=1 Tax=Mangrovimonas sp. ST2L15 TaxID=1645916 RepID=UPI0006B489E5|nr:glycosyltransferase family 2 protein [Mangrovimonas sp. ST2L15]